MSDIYERSNLLLGEENMEKISKITVAVFGLGGVGGTALMALARSGIKHFVLIDFDRVSLSNLNRQILFDLNDVGQLKTQAAKETLLGINEELDIKIIDAKVDSDFFDKYGIKSDYFIDAIDFVPGKLAIATYCQTNNIPFYMSLGMGNRLNPTKVVLTTLDRTSSDPLAKKIRQSCRKQGLDLSSIKVVVSEEVALRKGSVTASMMMVPSSAGLTLAYSLLLDCLAIDGELR